MDNIIIIRHGVKEYKNGKPLKGKPKHDPPLLKNNKKDIKLLCKEIKKPNIIYTSPFLRARETSELISEYFSGIFILPDNNLTEFLGYQKPKGNRADVDRVTENLISPILGMETLEDINERSKKIITNLKNDSLLVTHGIVIQFIYKNLTGKKYGHVKELNGIIIDKNKVMKLLF